MAEGKEGKKKKMHTHEVRTVAARDGTYVHHHTMKEHKDDEHTLPERQNVATSQNADEAGQHVTDVMSQNEGAAPAEGEDGQEPEGGGEPVEGGGEPAE